MYVDEKDAGGRDRLVIAEQRASSSSATIVPSVSGAVATSDFEPAPKNREGKAPLRPASVLGFLYYLQWLTDHCRRPERASKI